MSPEETIPNDINVTKNILQANQLLLILEHGG